MLPLRTALRRQKQPACLAHLSAQHAVARLSRPLALSCARHISSRASPYVPSKQSMLQQPGGVPKSIPPPPHCPGCGAPSQQNNPVHAGYYAPSRLRVKTPRGAEVEAEGDAVWDEAVERLRSDPTVDPELIQALGGRGADGKPLKKASETKAEQENKTPLCTRCNDLINHETATPLPSYPTLQTLANLLNATSHTHNHIYHLIDAADMPVTLQPQLMSYLHKHLPRNVFRNLTISYIVTRCDLLVHQREMLSGLESRIKEIIKLALPSEAKLESVGPFRENNRLHFVSSRSGWGIGRLKEEAASRKGGVWFFGGVNTGKSSLLRDLWPEGGKLRPVTVEDAREFDLLPLEDDAPEVPDNDWAREREEMEDKKEKQRRLEGLPEVDAVEYIITQKQYEQAQKVKPPPTPTHVAPTVSKIAGTTAAPLRILHRENVGRIHKKTVELVDLPGIERWVGMGDGGLLKYVRPELRKEVFMAQRVNRKVHRITIDQTMILGGLFLFQPKNIKKGVYEMTLANPFTALQAHVSRFDKTKKYFMQDINTTSDQLKKVLVQDVQSLGFIRPPTPKPREYRDDNGLDPLVEPKPAFDYYLPENIKSAGVFKLKDVVTARRNPKLKTDEQTSPEALAALPYRIFATDILIDGVGFVELTAQVRRDRDTGQFHEPEVEIFSPMGEGISQRPCLNLFMHLEKRHRELERMPKKKGKRPSKKGEKKELKAISKITRIGYNPHYD